MLCPNWGSRSISRPRLFNPTALDPEQWVLAAKALGVQEICLTAQHEGGFALWPSNWTNYSVASSPWMDGKGDVLRQFAVRSSFLSLTHTLSPPPLPAPSPCPPLHTHFVQR